MEFEQKIISLNSANGNKLNNSYNSNIFFNFGYIYSDADNIDYVDLSIQSAQIPVSFYIINVYNNQMKIQVGATVYTVNLTRGNYNSKNLITEIQTQFSQQGLTTLTITINSINGVLTFTNTSAFSILPASINKVLGFEVGTTYTSTLNIITPPYPLNLLGSRVIKIFSDDLQIDSYDSSVSHNIPILATLPVLVGGFGIILYDNVTNIKLRLANSYLNGFSIKMYDDDQNLINFNGQDWSITLTLDIHRKTQDTNQWPETQPLPLKDEDILPSEQQDQQQQQEFIPSEDDLNILLHNIYTNELQNQPNQTTS